MPAGPLHRGALRRLRARADVELCTKRGSGRQAAPALRLVPLLLTGNLCSSSARTPALVRMREARALAFARAFALVAAGAGRTFNPLVPESTVHAQASSYSADPSSGSRRPATRRRACPPASPAQCRAGEGEKASCLIVGCNYISFSISL